MGGEHNDISKHYFNEVRSTKTSTCTFSNFKVGAYLVTKDGQSFMGQMLKMLQ